MNKQVFLDQMEHYTAEIYPTFAQYFESVEALSELIHSMPDDGARKEFLYLAAMYHYLVCNSQLKTNGTVVPYFDNTHKFVTIVSLLEALSPDDDYVDFNRWLMSNSRAGLFPIKRKDMPGLFDVYASQHGITRRFVQTFSKAASWLTEQLSRSLSFTNSNGERVHYKKDKLAKQLYSLRSGFTHQLDIPFEFDATLVVRDGKVFYSQLTIQQLQQLFEHALLRNHGFSEEALEALAP